MRGPAKDRESCRALSHVCAGALPDVLLISGGFHWSTFFYNIHSVSYRWGQGHYPCDRHRVQPNWQPSELLHGCVCSSPCPHPEHRSFDWHVRHQTRNQWVHSLHFICESLNTMKKYCNLLPHIFFLLGVSINCVKFCSTSCHSVSWMNRIASIAYTPLFCFSDKTPAWYRVKTVQPLYICTSLMFLHPFTTRPSFEEEC